VLGREVEHAALNELVEAVRRAKGNRLIGLYCPSGRNEMVAHHYQNLGFNHLRDEQNGNTAWILDVADYVAISSPIHVVSI
jgi:predicted enzyme involved in methoxymalonyl-ACP biosynthesis